MRSRCHVGVHLVWATKHRTPWLSDRVRPTVFDILRRIAHRKHCEPMAVGGWVDHVHIYVVLSPQLSVIGLVKALKANSTAWIRENLPHLGTFEWQRGYGAWGVDPRDDRALRTYIQHQDTIHLTRQSGTNPAHPTEIASPLREGWA